MIDNQVTVVSNYANTIELQQTLNLYGESGYKLVNTDDNRFNIIGIRKKDLFEFMSDIQKRCDDEYIKAKFLLKTEE